MITYKEFAEGLVPYIKEAEGLKSASALDKDPNFRRWRHRVTELINQIELQGYRINCVIYNRDFGCYRGSSDDEKYVRDLDDTIIELETIFDNYCAYDVPKKIEIAAESNSIKSGLIPNIKEILLSLPIHKLWMTIAAILAFLGIIFYAGFYAGTFYEKHFSVESKAVIQDESAN